MSMLTLLMRVDNQMALEKPDDFNSGNVIIGLLVFLIHLSSSFRYENLVKIQEVTERILPFCG